MRVLVIDSHKSTDNSEQQSLHWKNAKIIAGMFDGRLIWSYKGVNDAIESDFDAIVFVHASHYAFTDYAWLERSPGARLFHVTNEYNLGEPRTLWMAAKRAGRRYTVIANHPPQPSKIVQKYVLGWEMVNLNALTYERQVVPAVVNRSGCVYYGSFRKDRSGDFARYLRGDMILSTHATNIEKFRNAGADCRTVPRLKWRPTGEGLFPFSASLYIEDVTTHTHYNYLANRFYEALGYGATTLFAESCRGTTDIAGYGVPPEYFVDDAAGAVANSDLPVFDQWHARAEAERLAAVADIERIIRAS